MVTPDDIGKIARSKSGSGLSGELLGFDDQGRAVIKRPFGKWHANPERVEVVCQVVLESKAESDRDVIKRLCEIIIDELPSNDDRYIYAMSKLPG